MEVNIKNMQQIIEYAAAKLYDIKMSPIFPLPHKKMHDTI